MTTKAKKTDGLKATLHVTLPVAPHGYDAAKKAIEALKIEGGKIEITFLYLARIKAE